MFLDDADFRRLRSLSHSDAVSADAVLAFLEAVFEAPGAGAGCAEDGGGWYAVLALDELSRAMDMKPEVMETLLTYLEVHRPFLSMAFDGAHTVQAVCNAYKCSCLQTMGFSDHIH
jgi:hypothetical protein